jgi:two-component system response regulator RegX3
MSNVLIIEDDNMLGDTLSLYLTGEGSSIIKTLDMMCFLIYF